MFQFKIIVLTALAIFTTAESLHEDSSVENRDALAHEKVQFVGETKGYAPSGFKPEIPFELPTESKKPNTVYGPPLTTDPQLLQPELINEGQSTSSVAQKPTSVYGPPQSSNNLNMDEIANTGGNGFVQQQPPTLYDPPLSSSESQQPANVYGPPLRSIENEQNIDNFEVLTVETMEPENFDSENAEVSINEDGSLVSVSTTFDNPGNIDERPARLAYQRFHQGQKRIVAMPERLVQARLLKPTNFIYNTKYQRF